MKNYHRVDWEQRDYQLAKEVRAASLSLKERAGPPRQITQNALAQKIGFRWLLTNKMKKKLPLTIQTLNEVAETCEAFAVRRVWWVVKTFSQDQMYLNRRQLLRQAGVEQAVQRWPLVENAVCEALQTLQLLRIGKHIDRPLFQDMFPEQNSEKASIDVEESGLGEVKE